MATIKPTITAYVSPTIDGEVRPECSPYLHKLALLVIAWNDLQMELSQLFYVILRSSSAFRMWYYSTDSERTRRIMLLEALPGIAELPRAKEQGKEWIDRAIADIEYILTKVTKLAGPRNDAVHSPYVFEQTGDTVKMVAFDFFGDPRAKALADKKDLLEEFNQRTDSLRVLAAFAQRVRLGLYLKPQPTWPERPDVPPPLRKKSRKE